MADFAFGISMKAVEEVGKKVKSAIKEEAEQWRTVQRDLVFIKDEFEMMQSFLNVADREHIKNKVVKTWVRQVRDMSYDAEDSIELVLHLDTKRLWLLRVCRRLWFSLLSACMLGAALPLDEAVDEIKLLKAKVEEVSQRNTRYNLIGDSSSKPIVQMQPTTAANTRKLDILIKARDAAKKQSGYSDLAELITNKDYDLQVISVCVTGDDIGAISVLKRAYDDPEIYNNFTCRAWVKLMHPFSPREFVGSLVAQFYSNPCQKQGRATTDLDVDLTWIEAKQDADLVKEFVRRFNERRYLVVVEDLCSVAEWHAVRMYLPDVINGSRIVVSTQQFEIASSCAGQLYEVLELKQYYDNHSVWIFYKKGLQRDGVRSLRGEGNTVVQETHEASFKEDGFHFVGRKSEVDELSNLMRELSNMKTSRVYSYRPHVVSVWGMAGVGKSALVRTVYDRIRSEGTQSKYAWVHVSHPFNLVVFCRSIVSNMLSGSHGVTDPIQECRRLLDDRDGCLLVIDGLQSKEDWDLIKTKLISGSSGTGLRCIIITTTQCVAKHAATADNTLFYIRGLQCDAALDLCKQVLWKAATIVSVDMIEEAKCFFGRGGRPRAIIAIARHLAHLFHGKRDTRSLMPYGADTEYDGSWRRLAELHSRFQACPQLLKKLFFYLSVFESNKIIGRSRLVRRWVAEGYFKGTDSHSLEEDVKKNVDELKDMGVIRAPQSPTMAGDMRTTSCQVNPLFLEYIISRETEESIFLPLEVSVLKEGCRVNPELIGLHLAIRTCWVRDKSVFASLDFMRLRSLTVCGNWESFFISDRMRVLRVLDLENAPYVTDDDLKKIGKLPPRLKFFSLRGCKYITRLPDSVSDLNQLQTLDIRGTSTTKLPKCIIKLRKLQYIRAGTTVPLAAEEPPSNRTHTLVPCLPNLRRRGPVGSRDGGVEVPRGIQHLTALETLGAVSVNTAGREAILGEIGSLEQLKKLHVSGINGKNSRSMLPKFARLEKLHTLCLGVKRDEGGELHFCTKSVGTDSSSPNPFGELKVLKIACGPSLLVKFDQGAAQKLELLKVHYYNVSSFGFSGLEHLTSLKQVWVQGSCDDAVKVALREQLGRHPKKPVLKLEERCLLSSRW